MTKDLLLIYILLAIFAGGICKIYDDMNDNNLFDYFKINNKDYINEFLKGLHYISFTILALNYPFFYIYYILLLTVNCFFDKKAYSSPYEFSGLLSSYIIILFIDYSKLSINYYDIMLFSIELIGAIIFEFNIIKNVEFSIGKLLLRTYSIFFFIFILTINNFYELFSANIEILMYINLAYAATSCISQYLFISNQNKNIENEKMKKMKKRKKGKKDEKLIIIL
jgi:hypothetical protein